MEALLPAKEAAMTYRAEHDDLDLDFECHPDNPECEYSEEHVSSDPASRTHVICLAHHDQIEAAKEAARAEALAMAEHDEKVWGTSLLDLEVAAQGERPF